MNNDVIDIEPIIYWYKFFGQNFTASPLPRPLSDVPCKIVSVMAASKYMIPPPPGFKPPSGIPAPLPYVVDPNARPAMPSIPGPTPTQRAADPSTLVTEDEAYLIIMKNLTAKNRRDEMVVTFVANYVQCRDLRQAAELTNITLNRAKKLYALPDVAECIKTLTERMIFKFGIDPGELVEKVKEVVGVDPAEMQNPDGSYIENMRDVPPEIRRAIKKFKAVNMYGEDENGMKVVTGKIIEVEFYNKLQAVEMLSSEVDVMKKKAVLEHDVTDKMAETLLSAEKRAEARARAAQGVPDITVTALPVPEVKSES